MASDRPTPPPPTERAGIGADPAPSPCTLVCAIGLEGWCLGCGRTLAEIATWSGTDVGARRAILAALPDRMARITARESRVIVTKPS